MLEGALREILAELDVQIVSKSATGWLNAHCPFAEYRHISGRDRSPDFFAKIDGQGVSGFHCFACHAKGRIGKLVRMLEHYREEDYHGLDIRADLADMPSKFEEWGSGAEHDVDPDPLNKAAYLSMYPLAYEHPDSRAYLVERGISEATAELLMLQYDDEEHRIMFPVFDHKADLYGFSGRSIWTEEQIEEENRARERRNFRLSYPKVRSYNALPKSKLLLGEQLMDTNKPQFVVEGLFAFAHCVEIGVGDYLNPIATMGAKMSEYQRDLLAGYAQPVWLAYDNDATGEKGIFGEVSESGKETIGAYEMCRTHVPTFIPYWPEGINDPDFLTLDDVLAMTSGETYVPG